MKRNIQRTPVCPATDIERAQPPRNRDTRFETPSICFDAIPDGKPLRTFSWNCRFFVFRNSGRKTATHFSWNCFRPFLPACAG
ncbi:hypothetical protein EOD23_00415 [Mesorhizobium sp. USDA-HM6]|nr:hypothetical protein EOD23_00415 [Mesorhizobium sp. USDA-HM6]